MMYSLLVVRKSLRGCPCACLQFQRSVATATSAPTTWSLEKSYRPSCPSFHLVYKPPLSYRLQQVKLVSFTMSALTLSVQPTLYHAVGSLSLSLIAVGTICSFFTFVTPVLIHLVAKRYATALWWDPKTQEFEVQNLAFWGYIYRTRFCPQDVHRPVLPGLFTSVLIKSKPVFFDPEFFTDADAYEKLMGFDVPVDYKLKQPPVDYKLKQPPVDYKQPPVDYKQPPVDYKLKQS